MVVDHLVGLVEGSELRGFGHQIGNLVPSCQPCNSSKGKRDWRVFVKSALPDPKVRQERLKILEAYLSRFAKPIDLRRVRRDSPELGMLQAKSDILELMRRADDIAKQLRKYTTANES